MKVHTSSYLNHLNLFSQLVHTHFCLKDKETETLFLKVTLNICVHARIEFNPNLFLRRKHIQSRTDAGEIPLTLQKRYEVN